MAYVMLPFTLFAIPVASLRVDSRITLWLNNTWGRNIYEPWNHHLIQN